jgi:hypothetical protein
MSISSKTLTQIDSQTFKAVWESTLPTPTYYVYRDKILSETINRNWTYIHVPPGEMVEFDVFDSPSDVPALAFPGKFYFSWFNEDDDIFVFEIAQLTDVGYVVVDRVESSTIQHYYEYMTNYLQDNTTYSFRITPIGFNQSRGVSVTFVQRMVRRPNPPTVNYSYNVNTGYLNVEFVE